MISLAGSSECSACRGMQGTHPIPTLAGPDNPRPILRVVIFGVPSFGDPQASEEWVMKPHVACAQGNLQLRSPEVLRTASPPDAR